MSSRSDVHRLVAALVSRLREQHHFCDLEDRPVASISLSDANNKWNKTALALVEKYRSPAGRLSRLPFDARQEEINIRDASKGYEINITAGNREWNKIALALLEKQKQALEHKW